MINEIIMQGAETCYKKETKLDCSHKINLIYGLNGVGKSTLSNFLFTYPNIDKRYANCKLNTLHSDEVLLVYNQNFIQKNFYESENQNGIFSLNSENKDALTAIDNANKKIDQLNNSFDEKNKLMDDLKTQLDRVKKNAEANTWKIKTSYTGGDRILDYCFEGLGVKNNSEKLFEYLLQIPLPSTEINSIESIKKDIQLFSDTTQNEVSFFPQCEYKGFEIETNLLFSKIIIGNQANTFSDVINALKNSDWVRKGLEYLPKTTLISPAKCPFCQNKTITNEFITNLKEYFDKSYAKDLNELEKLAVLYQVEYEKIPSKDLINQYPPALEYKEQYNLLILQLQNAVSKNIEKIKQKNETPSLPIQLVPTEALYNDLNKLIENINTTIHEYNLKIQKRVENLKSAKNNFWLRMRLDYDSTISSYLAESKLIKSNIEKINTEINDISAKVSEQKAIIVENQALTVNIDDAILNINSSLLDLGIADFSIKKYKDNLYSIIRNEDDKPIFKSLSEGEKMVISFLYFIEMCRGKSTADEISKKKIVVIDDPISSLSHIYVYNIGRLIQDEFIRSGKYEQLFVLSHSLYFIYELADNSDKRRKSLDEKMYRISKNSEGSTFYEMHYEEIQNDYHSYWLIARDPEQNPALVANCMRNIIDYFFNFVEKTDFNNVFQKPEFKNEKYQAFMRYINRESHSLGQNIFDIKEFNYQNFLDAFHQMFTLLGYEEHYNKMIRL